MSFNYDNKLKKLLKYSKNTTQLTKIFLKINHLSNFNDNMLRKILVNGSILADDFSNNKQQKYSPLFKYIYEETTHSYLFNCFEISHFKTVNYSLNLYFNDSFSVVFPIPEEIIIKEFTPLEKLLYKKKLEFYPKESYNLEFVQFVVEKSDEIA
jgi:hypothetical protein